MHFHLSNSRINYLNYLKRTPFHSKSTPYYFAYARTALKVGLVANMDKLNKRKVLIPSFICVEATKPFIELGIEIVYYDINEDFTPNWSNLTSLISSEIGALMMVHYFGLAQNIEDFKEVAQENALILIEDNSHGFGGIWNGQALGSIGDIGVLSPRKTLPIYNGGILHLKSENYLNQPLPMEPINLFSLLLKDWIARMLDYIYPLKKILLKTRINHHSLNDEKKLDWGIDGYTHNFIHNINTMELRTKRTNIYRIWFDWCKKNGIEAIEINHDSYAPMLFPILLKNKKARDQLFTYLQNKNIAVTILWGEQLPINDSAKNIKDKLLCLPINIDFNPQLLKSYLNKYCSICPFVFPD